MTPTTTPSAEEDILKKFPEIEELISFAEAQIGFPEREEIKKSLRAYKKEILEEAAKAIRKKTDYGTAVKPKEKFYEGIIDDILDLLNSLK